MTATQAAALLGVWAIAVVSPGPDVVVVLQRALAGRRHGVATAVGVVLGLTVWLGAAFAGVATLVRVYPQVMIVLQVAGGLLLATLGVLGVRGWWRDRAAVPNPASPEPTSLNPRPSPGIGDADGGSGSRGRVADSASAGPWRGGSARGDLARGLATNLANPKALVFFGAVLTPFLSGEVSVAWAVALFAVMLALAFVWFAGLAVIASHRVVNERVGRLMLWVDLVASALFVAVGVAFVIGALV